MAFANLVRGRLDGQPRRPDARRGRLRVAPVQGGRPDPRLDPRGGDREGPRRRGAGRAGDPGRRGRAAAGHARAGGGEPPDVEVFYNAEDPIKRRYVESTIRSQLAEANAALCDAVLARRRATSTWSSRAAKLSFPFVGRRRHPRPAQRATLVDATLDGLPEGRSAARGAGAGQPLRPARGRQPRRLASRSSPRSARRCRSSRPSSTARDAAGQVRGRRGGGDLADVRDDAAGRGPAGAGARGARLRRGWCAGSSPAPRCWRRRSCSPRCARSRSRW